MRPLQHLPLLRWLTIAVSMVLMACTACTASGQTDALTDRATELAKAIGSGDLDAVAGHRATTEFALLVRGMDGLRPTMTVRGVDQGKGEATFVVRWTLPSGVWTYESKATFEQQGSQWVPQWRPSIIHPDLATETRLVHKPLVPRRADITDATGRPLVTYRPVRRVGLNKPDIPATAWKTSAFALAKRVGVNPQAYWLKVEAAGDKAFVEAITLRAREEDPSSGIPGAMAVEDVAMLGPTKEFALGLLGVATPATEEDLKASKGALTAGMLVGRTGLQRRYDNQLRGAAGAQVLLRARQGGFKDKILLERESAPGRALRTTLSLESQLHAEDQLRKSEGASLVSLDPRTGQVRVAAHSATSSESQEATFGRRPPGSTYKIVTALALLRSGMTADTLVNCTDTVTVNGRRFKNYNDFPSHRVGTMTLREAIALSCNTALIAEHGRVDSAALRRAAQSLGMGQDWDAGFPAFFGTVPDAPNVVGLAEAMIGQGNIEASPLAMAAVTASVAAGRTIRPQLLLDYPASPPAAPELTPSEAAQLRDMMQAVVSQGSATFLGGHALGAKTGTAEYGVQVPPKTHGWMTAFTSTAATAVLVHDGSGAKTAGPLLLGFLR